MVASNSDLAAAVANILMPTALSAAQAKVNAPNINIPARLPLVNNLQSHPNVSSTGTGGINAAIAALNAIGNAANASKQTVSFDPSGFNAIDNVAANIANRNNLIANAKPVNIDFNSTLPDQSSGHSDWLGTLLNDTVEQPAGLIRSTLNQMAGDVKNDWNSNVPWWQKGLNILEDLSPQKAAGDALGQAWGGIKAGASQQMKDWTDGKLTWGDALGGFFDGMANHWTTGEQLNNTVGINKALDSTFTNKALQQNSLDWWSNAGSDFSHGNILGGLGNILGGATLGVAGDINQGLSKLDGTWVNNIPLLGQLPTASKAIMGMNPNGHQAVDQVGGLLTEIATDPLTYLDGAGIATKAGKAAELGKMQDIANSVGLAGKFKDSTSFEAALTNKLKGDAVAMQTAAQTNRAKQLAQSIGIDSNLITHPADLVNEAQQMIGQKYPNLPSVTTGTIDNMMKELDNTGQIYSRLADKQIADHMAAVNAARATAANGALNTWGLSLPFSNATIKLGNVPEKFLGFIKNPLYHSEATLGDANVHIAQNLIHDVANGDMTKATQLENAAKQYYQVNDLKDLTKTQYADFVDKMAPAFDKTNRPIPDSKITESMVDKSMPNQTFDINTKAAKPVENVTYNHSYTTIDDIMKSLHDANPQVAAKVEPLVRGLGDVNDVKRLAPEAISMYGDFAKQIMKTAKGKTLDQVQKAFQEAADIINKTHATNHTATITKAPDIMYKELNRIVEHFKQGNPEIKDLKNTKDFYKVVADLANSKYTKVNNAKSALDHFFEGKNPFNARTLGTGDKFTNSLANHIADANSAKVGLKAQHGADMANIEKYIKKNNITSKEMTDTIYHLESQAPKSYGKDWQPSDRVTQLADLIKPVLDRVGNQEMNAGTLDALRQNYFPHVLNPETDMQKLADFKDRHPDLFGVNQNNKFNQSRTTFQTMADAQDHLDALGQKMAKTTDPKELADLQAQVDRTRNLFDQNIPSALHERIRAGANAIANKDMQANFKKFGALVINPKEAHQITSNMEKLDSGTAKKLGLNPEDQNYLHKDVLNGLKRIDDVFTAEGMNKFVRNVNAITDIFRTGVTTFKFSHYRNNIIGNVINNMAAGVGARDYLQANKMLQRMRSGTMTAADHAIIDSAYKHNIINGGFVSDIMHNGGLTFKDPTALEKAAKMVSNFKPAKVMRGKMEQIDDVSRLGNYINGLKKFGDSEKAANQVRTYLFNYNEMTNMDRVMRMMIPFWNWTKRNIPLQMKNILERPAIAVNFEKTKDQFNNGQAGADWQKDSGIKLPFLDNYTTVPSPTDDLKQLGNPLGLISSLNPVAKMGIEMAANKNLYTGNPISYGSKTTQMKDVPSYVAKNFGVANDIGSLIGSIFGQGNKTPTEVLTNYINPESKINRGRATVK